MKVGMALHSTGGGKEAFKIWDSWSASGSLYRLGECEEKWQTFSCNGNGTGKVTLRSLWHIAREHGWDEPAAHREIIEGAVLRASTNGDPGALYEREALLSLKELQKLDAPNYQRIRKTIKDAGLVGITQLEKTASQAHTAEDDGELTHLDLARRAIDEIGPENILCTQPHTWKYNASKGYWEPLEARAERQIVQTVAERPTEGEITKNVIDSVVDLLRTESYRPYHEWDVGPADVVVCSTGEITLVDGKWVQLPHRREHFRTTGIPIAYDPAAHPEKFEQFLEQLVAGDEDAQEKIQAALEMMGYTLMSHAQHERFVVLVGSGANGKSVLLHVLEQLVGTRNVAGVQPSSFENKFQRAHLMGKLANIVTEIREGEVIADAALKGIVSGEASTVEQKFRDPFVLHPYSTCWFGTNHLPHTRDFSDALFRRTLILQFNREFKGSAAKPELKTREYWEDELPGILNLALDAYAKALENGFTDPASSIEARDRWRTEVNQAACFVEEDCISDPDAKIGSDTLFRAYRDWAVDQGIKRTLSQKSFSQRISSLGYRKKKEREGAFFYGLRTNKKYHPRP
jgi:putative DNA primase/helicase